MPQADKDIILQAIATLAANGTDQADARNLLVVHLAELTTEFRAVNEHLVRLTGAIARHETEVIALKLRAASRDAACPLVEVLRAEVQGVQSAILKALQEARDVAVAHRGEVEAETRWENRLMPFIRPAVIALISALLTLIVIRSEEHTSELQ